MSQFAHDKFIVNFLNIYNSINGRPCDLIE